VARVLVAKDEFIIATYNTELAKRHDLMEERVRLHNHHHDYMRQRLRAAEKLLFDREESFLTKLAKSSHDPELAKRVTEEMLARQVATASVLELGHLQDEIRQKEVESASAAAEIESLRLELKGLRFPGSTPALPRGSDTSPPKEAKRQQPPEDAVSAPGGVGELRLVSISSAEEEEGSPEEEAVMARVSELEEKLLEKERAVDRLNKVVKRLREDEAEAGKAEEALDEQVQLAGNLQKQVQLYEESITELNHRILTLEQRKTQDESLYIAHSGDEGVTQASNASAPPPDADAARVTAGLQKKLQEKDAIIANLSESMDAYEGKIEQLQVALHLVTIKPSLLVS